MLKINKDQMRLPFGGHHYYESGLMIKGDNFEQVRDKLSYYRLDNNKPVGNPGQDILTYYKVNFPWMVKEDDIEMPEEDDQFIRWRAWVQKTWTRPPKKSLTKTEAAIRWEVCKSCEFNKKLVAGLRSSEQEELKKKTFLLRKGIDIPQELGYCSLHGFDLSVAVFIEAPKDHSDKAKDAPDKLGCWV